MPLAYLVVYHFFGFGNSGIVGETIRKIIAKILGRKLPDKQNTT